MIFKIEYLREDSDIFGNFQTRILSINYLYMYIILVSSDCIPTNEYESPFRVL